ncbi:hypothetical protein [Niabella hirudinis]|uniref:hypothetical protein n=1 Tax=Niabella hirudinis TaxID=1285929 RepID=UPI003EB78514
MNSRTNVTEKNINKNFTAFKIKTMKAHYLCNKWGVFIFPAGKTRHSIKNSVFPRFSGITGERGGPVTLMMSKALL